MGIGHVAIGLGLKKADPAINTGWLIFAALLADFLLGWFALAGWETYQVPPDYSSKHYLLFTFPWSHGLVSDLVWATLAGLVAIYFSRRLFCGLVVAFAVVSHFFLDGLVHIKGLPLFFGETPALGLGLWRNLPLALALEVGMAAVGLAIYFVVTRAHRSGRAIGMTVYVAILTIVLVTGQATTASAPHRAALIGGWLVSPILISGIAFLLDRKHKPAGFLTMAQGRKN